MTTEENKRILPSPLVQESDQLVRSAATNEEYPIVGGIIRFVEHDPYASSFGLQWNTYRRTQLDSYTETTISKDRLTRLSGGSLDVFKGKYVLEAGCGSGRFTEIMLEADARLFSVDLSSAVEACYANLRQHANLCVAQGDLLQLPIEAEQFDIVVCIGVIQHTPNPEETMIALCSYVKPGGLLIVDHYSHAYPVSWSRRMLRKFLLRRSSGFSIRFVKILTTILWPIHRLLKRASRSRFQGSIRPIRRFWLNFSPIVDYYDAYPQLGHKLLREWAMLDTHDTLTDTYKHLRSANEITEHLQECGMVDIETEYTGNGVEARARKPER